MQHIFTAWGRQSSCAASSAREVRHPWDARVRLSRELHGPLWDTTINIWMAADRTRLNIVCLGVPDRVPFDPGKEPSGPQVMEGTAQGTARLKA